MTGEIEFLSSLESLVTELGFGALALRAADMVDAITDDDGVEGASPGAQDQVPLADPETAAAKLRIRALLDLLDSYLVIPALASKGLLRSIAQQTNSDESETIAYFESPLSNESVFANDTRWRIAAEAATIDASNAKALRRLLDMTAARFGLLEET